MWPQLNENLNMIAFKSWLIQYCKWLILDNLGVLSYRIWHLMANLGYPPTNQQKKNLGWTRSISSLTNIFLQDHVFVYETKPCIAKQINLGKLCSKTPKVETYQESWPILDKVPCIFVWLVGTCLAEQISTVGFPYSLQGFFPILFVVFLWKITILI